MAKIVLILGGARSGKSEFAQRLAAEVGGGDVLYVATGEALDQEMTERIEKHRQSRPAEWELLEMPSNVGQALAGVSSGHAAVVIDCLTLLLSNVMAAHDEEPATALAESRVEQEIGELLAACHRRKGTAIIVSNEVGLGIVPQSALGRLYRDLLGRANQQVAAVADATYFMVAGRPLELNQPASSIENIAAKLREPANPKEMT